MTPEKVRSVIESYRQKLEDMGTAKGSYSREERVTQPEPRTLSHCYHMLEEMDKLVAEGRMEKAFRWLGFVQGVFWAVGLYSIDELKNHSRPIE